MDGVVVKMDDEKLMQEIDAAYMRAKHGKAYLGDEMGKAIASGQKASHAANEWMMLRAEARKRGLIPDLGVRAAIAQAPAPVRVKPLIFSEFTEGGCMGRPHPFQYFITQARTGRFLCHHDETWHDTLEAAQSHAQAAYQLAALEAPAAHPTNMQKVHNAPDAGVVAELVEALRIAGPIALADFANHPFVLNEDEKRKVAVVSAALALIAHNTTEG